MDRSLLVVFNLKSLSDLVSNFCFRWRMEGGIHICLIRQEGDDTQNDKQNCQDQDNGNLKWGHGILLSLLFQISKRWKGVFSSLVL